MGSEERLKRPDLPRTAPVRQFRDAGAQSGEAGSDPIGRGVGMGYRVISDYVRRGQEAARSFSAGPGAALPADPQKLAARMVQYGSDLMAAWLEFVQVSMTSSMGQPPPPPSEPRPFSDIAPAANPAGAAPASAAACAAVAERPSSAVPAMAVRLEASRPATVRWDLHAGQVPGQDLVVHDLRAPEPEKPRIAAPVLGPAPSSSGWVLHVVVPREQPAGIYSGMIIDARTSLPAGTVSVQIEE